MSITDCEALTQIPGLRATPDFEEDMGYRGDARYVVFYFDAEMDGVRYDDGTTDGDANHEGWTGFLAGAVAAEALRPYGLDKCGPATHMLFLDRLHRSLSVGRVGVLTESLRAAMAGERL